MNLPHKQLEAATGVKRNRVWTPDQERHRQRLRIPGEPRWSRQAERRRRDELAFMGALAAHRRRYGPGAPLCSTSFGGSTVPPLFGGGGGAPATLIFLRSVGTVLKIPNGAAQTPVPSPTIANDDMLYTCVAGNVIAAADALNPGWVAQNYNPTFSFAYEVYRRQADLTASDVFQIPAFGNGNVTAFTYSMGNTDLPVGQQLAQTQGGGLDSATDATWNCPAITAGSTNEIAVFMWGYRFRTIASVAAPTVVPAGTLQTVAHDAQSFIGAPQNQASWITAYWDYQATPTAVGAFVEGYTPDPTTAAQLAQFTKWRLI